MKRKLPSSEKGKRNQAITKFFKSLTSQGPKRSCTSVDNSRMKTTKEEEFRTPLFEKFQATKTKLVSKDTSNATSSDDNVENDKGKSCNSEVKPSVNDQSSPSVSRQNKVVFNSSPVVSHQNMSLNSALVTGVSNCNRALDNSLSVERDRTEFNGIGCNESFHSAFEEVDTSYDTCHESLTDTTFMPVHNKSILNNTASKGEFPDVNLSGAKERDLHASLNMESRTDDVLDDENNRFIDRKEHEESFDQIDKPSTALLSKDTETCAYFHEESKTKTFEKDQNSNHDNLMEGEQNFGVDDLKEEKCGKDRDQIVKLSKESHPSDDFKEAEHDGSHGDCKETDGDSRHGDFKAADHGSSHGDQKEADHDGSHGNFKEAEPDGSHGNQKEADHDGSHGDFKEAEHDGSHGDCRETDRDSRHGDCKAADHDGSHGDCKEAELDGSHGDHKKADHDDSHKVHKETEHDNECDQIDKSFNDIFLDKDLNDGDISEGSDSSDEDLLTPPRFLYEKMQLKPNIRTPEKGIAPAFSTPSPITRDVEREDKTKYKLSFDKLIKEKAKRREKDAELAEMEAELQRGLEKGGVAQMQVPSTFSDIESEEELTDDGRDLKDCILPKDIKKFLVDVHDFSEELPGEDIFPMFHPYVTSQDFPRLSMVPDPNSDTFEAKLLYGSDSDLQELLCGGWILQCYLDRPCPSEVADWLFQVMCRHTDQHIVSSSFQVLWALVEAATENREDLPPDPRGSLWVPSIKNIIKELLSFGAIVPRLYPGDLVNQLNIKELLSSENSSEEIQMEDVTGSGEPQTEYFPIVNIIHLVQFLTHCLQKCPLGYIVQDLRNLMVMLCRLALDVRLQTVVFDVEMCLAAVLNCFGEMQWPDEIAELCSIVAKLSTNHRNLLHLVQIQPPSVRGIQLQRLLSITLLHWLVMKFCRRQEPGKSVDDERCEVTVPDSVEVSSLVKLVEKIKPGDNSNYFLLHTIISLVSLAVGSEDLTPKERGSLEKLTNKLRTLNGDIKDPRAAFMNRTKVKDLLVRTILRLVYMTQCIKQSREHQITRYFECSGSDYQVELLKETEPEIGENSSGNEEAESAARGQEKMDCST